MVVTRGGMASVIIIIIWFKKLWVIVRGGQRTKRVFRDIRNGSWKKIRDILGSFFGRGLSSMGMGGRFKSGVP